MDQRLVEDIKKSEGCKLVAYKDSLGFWTIGYGHLLWPQSQNWSGYTITQEIAGCWLEDDIIKAQNKAYLLPEWTSLDTDCRRNAVIELEFNISDKWRSFTKTREAIMGRDWKVAHDELLNSLWAKQVGAVRSTRIANYLLTGEY